MLRKKAIPEYDRKPTFEEVVQYAVDNNIYGKINLSKFYDYYDQHEFSVKGIPINWKTKLQEWANRQTGSVVVSAKEASARQKLPEKRVYNMFEDGKTTNVMDYLAWAVANI